MWLLKEDRLNTQPISSTIYKAVYDSLFISNTYWRKRFTLQAVSLLGMLSLFEGLFYLNDYVSDTLLSQKIIQNVQPNSEIWLVYVMPHHGFQAGKQRGASDHFTVNMSGKNMIFRSRERAWLLQVHRIWVDSCNSKKIWWAWICYNISVIIYTK